MAHVSNLVIQRKMSVLILILPFVLRPLEAQSQYGRPVADAGPSRYVAQDPLVLDGTGSYDPDNFGALNYGWRQKSGPVVVIIDAETAMPTISGFAQTNEIQECELELTVNDGELTSLSAAVKIKIVPEFGESLLELRNDSFDPNKPTMIYFGGGDCVNGLVQYSACPLTNLGWLEKANILSFPKGYGPDPGSSGFYYRCGDMILVYLSAVAPNYTQPIQACGWSTGGQPAIDVGRYLNLTYQDRRYAINRVTLFDATPYCRDYSERISQFLGSSVDGEQCWIDNYVSSSAWSSYTKYPYFYNNVLNIWFEKGMGGSAYGSAEWWRKHRHAQEWYNNSLSEDNLKDFNSGVVAGASWSVVGPGKNLQLASTPHSQTYKFQWYGWNPSGYIDFYDETRHAGRLPEPVTLIGPPDGSFVDANGALFSCEESENATSYELLFGSDPHSLGDYVIISHTPLPPRDVITAFPFRRTWWTIKVWDQFGSSIYADPLCIDADNVVPTVCEVENVSTGNGYNLIQYAIDEAVSGDEIVVKAGVYTENIDFKGKNLSVRSVDPNDSGVVASTILAGSGYTNMVTFANGEDSSCVLAGFTITDARNGIHCSGASPTIVSCRITANVSNGMELHMGSNPVISNCVIADNGHSGVAMLLFQEGRTVLTNSPSVVNCTVVNNSEIGVSGGAARVLNSIISGNRVQILGSSGTVEYSNVQAGYPGAGNIDADPLFADPENGEYHLKSQAGRYDATTQTWIVDSVISPCIDAGDPTSPIGLETSPNAGRINMGAYGGTAEASKSP